MRTTEEQTTEILNRITHYKVKQKRRRKATLSISLCLLVFTISLGTIHSLSKKQNNTDYQEETSVLEAETTSVETNEDGITLSSIALPSAASFQLSDMLPLVVYKGRIYQNSKRITCNQKEKDALVGTFLGTATGSIDEWTMHSNPDEYNNQFASTFLGDIYMVSGYSSDFRLCTFYQEDDVFYVDLLDHLDGITLHHGKDIIDTRLSLRKNYQSISFSIYHDDPDFIGDTPKTTVIKKPIDTITTFLDTLNDAVFFRDEDFLAGPTAKQFLVSFTLNDDTYADFLVYENGYVKYTDIYDPVYLHVSGDAFDDFFKLLCERSK